MLEAPLDRKGPPLVAPAWCPEELAQIATLTDQIDGFAAARHRPPVDSELTLALSDAVPLVDGLASNVRALLTRQLIRALGFDELRLPQWRLEHKLVQALVLRHYASSAVPVTSGLDSIVSGMSGTKLVETLGALFPSGFVIKPCLGDTSGQNCDLRTQTALEWIANPDRPRWESRQLADQEFIAQQKIPIREEYRVHTVEDRVIEDLTIRRYRGSVVPGERDLPNRWVQMVLDLLPAGITSGALLAWDVAVAEDGSLSAIEMNVGGMHTVHNPGFHSSGFYHHDRYGCVYTARLCLFVERTYHCRVEVIADTPEFSEANAFYEQVIDWKSRF